MNLINSKLGDKLTINHSKFNYHALIFFLYLQVNISDGDDSSYNISMLNIVQRKACKTACTSIDVLVTYVPFVNDLPASHFQQKYTLYNYSKLNGLNTQIVHATAVKQLPDSYYQSGQELYLQLLIGSVHFFKANAIFNR